MSRRRTYTVTRTRGDRVLTWPGLTEREARQMVMYCAHDNLGMGPSAANAHANRANLGEPYQLEGYVFTFEREGQ